ncbi:MAG: spondin domain-containing protein [Planctomycetota bacterium]
MGAALAFPAVATAQPVSIPSVVVTVENAQVGRGVFLTPPWIGIHDGTFDTYDGGSPASVPLGGNEIEALAEDGNNGPITATFSRLQPNAPQVSGVVGPAGPLAPGEAVSVTLNVDPMVDRYFSYASMIIPSNDAFIANGNPQAHELFDSSGAFVGQPFVVSGDETNDAGTEGNDEIAANVAFLGQAAPNTGTTEMGVVVSPSPGFAAAGALMFPNGVLNHPAFANGDFNDDDDRVFSVRFQFVDLGRTNRYMALLSADQEVLVDAVTSGAGGSAVAVSRRGDVLRVSVIGRGLSGPIQMAHLHLGARGVNGPLVVDMTSGIRAGGQSVSFRATASDLAGPLAGASFVSFLNEVAAGNVYINLHTAQFPGGEVRGQIQLLDPTNDLGLLVR